MNNLGNTIKESVNGGKAKEKKQKSQINKKSKKKVICQKNNMPDLNAKLFMKNIKKHLTKEFITFFVVFLLDIILVVWLAGKNVVNYAVIMDKEIFVSKTRYLLFGRNYVNLIVITFFYIYTCLVNKFFLHRKNSKRFLIFLFVFLAILNVGLFVLFTKRIY